MKVACFSVAAMDFFPHRNEYFAGGNSLNQAIRFRQLGHTSAFIGALGTDIAGDRIEALLRKSSVDVSHVYRIAGDTASNKIINDDAGERYGVEGAWNGGVYESFRLSASDWDYMAACDIWATHANGANYADALKRKNGNTFLVVDFLHFNTYELLLKGMDKVDIAYFGGVKEQLPDLIDISRQFKGLIVLTLGAGGSIAIQNGITYTQEALPLEKVVDTTGCGDAFQAGFSAEYYTSRDIPAALFSGASLGKTAAENYGGVPWAY